MASERKAIIIDTDPGIDDAAAIFWLLSDKRFDIKALTITHGNIGVEGCALNALRILSLAGRDDIPVYKGAPKPMLRPLSSAAYAHGKDGLGDTDIPFSKRTCSSSSASVQIADIARSSEGKITVLAIGPLTNIALAILIEPELKNYVESIVFMGGAVRTAGNVSPVASFNVYSDPEAARIVYNSGIPVVQVGLDICNMLQFKSELFDDLGNKKDSAVSVAMAKMASFRLRQIGKGVSTSVARKDSIALNDVAAAAYLMHPELFSTESASGDIATDGISRGMTVLDFDNRTEKEKNVLFACDADAESIVSLWASGIAGIKGGVRI